MFIPVSRQMYLISTKKLSKVEKKRVNAIKQVSNPISIRFRPYFCNDTSDLRKKKNIKSAKKRTAIAEKQFKSRRTYVLGRILKTLSP